MFFSSNRNENLSEYNLYYSDYVIDLRKHGFYLTANSVQIGAPEPKTTYIEIEGANGVIDVSQALTDDIKYYDDDYITDKSNEFFISEYVREKILRYTNDEVPHSITCVTENIKVGRDATEVDVLIIVEKENIKKIIVGHQGEMIKRIGIESRKDIEKLLGRKVYLNLFVKTVPKWRDKDKYLVEFGYKNNE